MFSQIRQGHDPEITFQDDTNGATAFDLDYQQADRAVFFFKFRLIMPVGNKKAVKIKHGYEFNVDNPQIMDSPSKELSDFFSTLVINSLDVSNKLLGEKKIGYDKQQLQKVVHTVLFTNKN